MIKNGASSERSQQAWARLRFAVIGGLLAAPPRRGELAAELERLATKQWRHPHTGEPLRLGRSTIERWYYTARAERDPVGSLTTAVRKDAGTQPSLGEAVRAALGKQYAAHAGWSVQLHYDNLLALGRSDASLGEVASYSTIRRYMKATGLRRVRRPRGRSPGEQGHEARETRSFESSHVHGLWHADFHHGSRQVLCADGRWRKPIVLAFVDDHSRLCCHAQWYLDETAESFVHALVQAIEKRGLPRALQTDNGSAMRAAETTAGLERLGITHKLTVPRSPNQNGKQEVLWGSVEGRLMAMLEGVEDLDLAQLQEATQAWIEMEYHREKHSETGEAPLERYLRAPHLGRRAPSHRELVRAFRAEVSRRQRASDGTLSLGGIRYEIPARLHHLERLQVRFASWDMTAVDVVDARTGEIVCPLYPVDKQRNADGRRKLLPAVTLAAGDEKLPAGDEAPAAPASGVAPLLGELICEYAASGLPPAYIPKPNRKEED